MIKCASQERKLNENIYVRDELQDVPVTCMKYNTNDQINIICSPLI